MNVNLAGFHIPGSQEAYYIPDFVTLDEEEYVIRKICESPRQKWKHLSNRRLQVWGGELTSQNVLIRQDIPSFLNTYPDILTRLQGIGAFNDSPHGTANQVLMNEYLPGQGIMPHEDGPSYYPVVATVSLGAHTIFHYYDYKSSGSHPSVPEEGRAVNPTPVLSVLLEPRSVIITASTLYTSRLHGIQEVEEDVIVPGVNGEAPQLANTSVLIANWSMLTGEKERRVVREGGVLRRGVRYSLTCRDVAKVVNPKSFGRY